MKKRVLVVDDSAFAHAEIEYLLEGSDYEIVGRAKDDEQALALYAELLPDVVTMDIIMPGMDGLDISRHILDQWPDARIVVVSALMYDDIIGKAQTLGISGFIHKPIKREAFLETLDKAAGSDRG